MDFQSIHICRSVVNCGPINSYPECQYTSQIDFMQYTSLTDSWADGEHWVPGVMQDSDQRMVAARRAAKDSLIAQIWVHYMKKMQCALGETDWMQYNYMSCMQQKCAFCTLSFVNIKGKVYCTYMENLMLDIRNDDLSWFCLLWTFHRLRIRSDREVTSEATFCQNYGVRFCDDVAFSLILLNQNFHWNVTPELICSFFRRLNRVRE